MTTEELQEFVQAVGELAAEYGIVGVGGVCYVDEGDDTVEMVPFGTGQGETIARLAAGMAELLYHRVMREVDRLETH